MQMLGMVVDFLHDPVNAITDSKRLLHRLDVNVTGAGLVRLYEDLGHQFDDGGIRIRFGLTRRGLAVIARHDDLKVHVG